MGLYDGDQLNLQQRQLLVLYLTHLIILFPGNSLLRCHNCRLNQYYTHFYISQKTSCLVQTNADISLLRLVKTG